MRLYEFILKIFPVKEIAVKEYEVRETDKLYIVQRVENLNSYIDYNALTRIPKEFIDGSVKEGYGDLYFFSLTNDMEKAKRAFADYLETTKIPECESVVKKHSEILGKWKSILRIVSSNERNTYAEYVQETARQLNNKEDVDGYGYPRAWIQLPENKSAEITFEEGKYSALLHDADGNPELPYINADNLHDLFATIIDRPETNVMDPLVRGIMDSASLTEDEVIEIISILRRKGVNLIMMGIEQAISYVEDKTEIYSCRWAAWLTYHSRHSKNDDFDELAHDLRSGRCLIYYANETKNTEE